MTIGPAGSNDTTPGRLLIHLSRLQLNSPILDFSKLLEHPGGIIPRLPWHQEYESEIEDLACLEPLQTTGPVHIHTAAALLCLCKSW